MIFKKKTRAPSSCGDPRFNRADAIPVYSTRKSIVLALSSVALLTAALPASAANWWTSTPTLSIGSASVNVRNAGARGDGVHDDTAAFQAAINSLPTSGGTITVPAGTYRINALKSINMRSHTRLKMDPLAQLVAIPNNQTRSYVVKAWRVNNVEIVGGSIVGERMRHIGDSGEWGMGIDILASSKVYVHDLKVSNCWGDGLYVGSQGSAGNSTPSADVTIKNVVSDNNRRQGLSVGPVNHLYILNSTFSNTHGTKPQAGIDIEPMSTRGLAQNIRIEKSRITGNGGSGVEAQAHVTGLTLTSNTIKGNTGYGVYGNSASHIAIAGNLITENWLFGVSVKSTTHDVDIVNNTITYNSTRGFYLHNKSIYQLVSGARDIEVASTTRNVHVSGNTISRKP